jgi:large subunit ribosomal protein L10
MPRPEKVQAVADIKERIANAQAVFLAEYSGLSVKQQQQLRRSLRHEGAEFKVVKMTLARRAVAELEIDSLDELLLGPTGLTYADGDPVTAAKALKDFARDHEVMVIKGGLLGSEFLTPERISELAEIEPRDVLLAKVAGLIKAPMANLAGLLAAMPRNMASAMQQLLEKKEEEAPAVAEVADVVVVDEEAADEVAAEVEAADEVAAEVEAAEVEAAEVEAADEVVAEEAVVEASDDEPAGDDDDDDTDQEDDAKAASDDDAQASADADGDASDEAEEE